MNIGIITFHAAYNFGAMLQNYALQQTLISLGHSVKTINLRTWTQIEKYNFFIPLNKLSNKKLYLRSILFAPYKKTIKKRNKIFEDFLSENLLTTEQIEDISQVSSLEDFDAYIVGSDQCWNVGVNDFDWGFLMDFVPAGKKKLSYAVSMGGKPQKLKENFPERIERLKGSITSYEAISVREIETKQLLDSLNIEKEVSVHVDPTLLLKPESWTSLIDKKPIVDGKYIFLYTPFYMANAYQHARALSKYTGLKVVTSVPSIQAFMHYPDFEKVLQAGPKEFLNLVANAEYVIGKSFHLLAFATIFHKKMLIVGGRTDSRLSNLLNTLQLKNCAIENVEEIPLVIDNINTLSFVEADKIVIIEAEKAINWLKEHLK